MNKMRLAVFNTPKNVIFAKAKISTVLKNLIVYNYDFNHDTSFNNRNL